MDKINKTTMIGLLVLTLIIGVGLTSWIMGGKRTEQPIDPSSPTASTPPTTQIDPSQNDSSTELAPIYEESDDQPFIQISKETKEKSELNNQSKQMEIPSGFGITNETDDQTQTTGSERLKEMAVELETPVDSALPNVAIEENNSGIEAIDPREVGITANDGPDQNFEETVLTVQRTLTAVNPEGEKQLIRLKIPVMYKSRTLRLEGSGKQKAIELLARFKEKSNLLATLKLELEKDLTDWNELVRNSTPYESLLPESPTLPQNQSAGSLNRDNDPSMSAGKAISYEIINN